MTTKDIREFLQGFSTDELKARKILFGPRNLLMGFGLRPLMALMNEAGVTRLESLAHGWFLDEKGQFRNSKSGELKEGNIADLQRPGNVFNYMNEAINPHFLIPESSTTPENELEAAEELKFGIERDMQDALRRNIEQLESGLKIIDGGKERIVDDTLRIDITAQDRDGKVVVIELKAGTAGQESITQTLAYMASIQSEEKRPVRGILIAADFPSQGIARGPSSVESPTEAILVQLHLPESVASNRPLSLPAGVTRHISPNGPTLRTADSVDARMGAGV